MAYTKIGWVNRAVQFAQRYFINTDGGNDKQILPPFSDWTKHANATINSDYSLTLVATAIDQTTEVRITLIPNQQYTMSRPSVVANTNYEVAQYNSAGTYLQSAYIGTSLSVTFTTHINTSYARFIARNAATGTFNYDNPQLELGSSATSFTPKKMYTIVQSGGTVTAAGTPVNASNLDRMDQHLFMTNNIFTTTGTANTYATTIAGITAITDLTGVPIKVKINISGNAASTLNVNSYGAKGIKKANGNNMINLTLNGIYTLVYDGTNFILQGEGGAGNAQPSEVLAGKTFTNDINDQVGTMTNYSIDTVGTNYVSTSGRLYIRPPSGYWNNVYYTYWDDPDFIASNISKYVDIFGITGTAIPVASGTVTTTASNMTISGLSFTPTFVLAYMSHFSNPTFNTFMWTYEASSTNLISKTIWNQTYDVNTTSSGNQANVGNKTALQITVSGGSFTILSCPFAGDTLKWWAF